MAKTYVDKLGHKNGAKSPSGVQNAEHHDLSGSKKVIKVTPGTVQAILADSTVATPLQPRQMVRLFNTTGAVAYVWIGLAGTAPGSVTAANGLAIGPNSEMILASGEREDGQSDAIKASVSGVQAALIES